MKKFILALSLVVFSFSLTTSARSPQDRADRERRRKEMQEERRRNKEAAREKIRTARDTKRSASSRADRKAAKREIAGARYEKRNKNQSVKQEFKYQNKSARIDAKIARREAKGKTSKWSKDENGMYTKTRRDGSTKKSFGKLQQEDGTTVYTKSRTNKAGYTKDKAWTKNADGSFQKMKTITDANGQVLREKSKLRGVDGSKERSVQRVARNSDGTYGDTMKGRVKTKDVEGNVSVTRNKAIYENGQVVGTRAIAKNRYADGSRNVSREKVIRDKSGAVIGIKEKTYEHSANGFAVKGANYYSGTGENKELLGGNTQNRLANGQWTAKDGDVKNRRQAKREIAKRNAAAAEQQARDAEQTKKLNEEGDAAEKAADERLARDVASIDAEKVYREAHQQKAKEVYTRMQNSGSMEVCVEECASLYSRTDCQQHCRSAGY